MTRLYLKRQVIWNDVLWDLKTVQADRFKIPYPCFKTTSPPNAVVFNLNHMTTNISKFVHSRVGCLHCNIWTHLDTHYYATPVVAWWGQTGCRRNITNSRAFGREQKPEWKFPMNGFLSCVTDSEVFASFVNLVSQRGNMYCPDTILLSCRLLSNTVT